MTADDSSGSFFTTRWTRVARSKGSSVEAQAALAELCESYYDPVHAFLRATVRDDEEARDLTQAFFARVLDQQAFEGADPQRGRFRSFLLGAVKHFLSDHRRRGRAEKRGGGESPISFEDMGPGSDGRSDSDTSPGWTPPDLTQLPPDCEFDRRWALTVITKALAQIRQSMTAKGQETTFQVLKPWLTGDNGNLRQSHAALELGLSQNATKVAIHRLRRQFREAVKAEISQTLADPAQVAQELSHLEAALRN